MKMVCHLCKQTQIDGCFGGSLPDRSRCWNLKRSLPQPPETLVQCAACNGEGGFVRVIRVYEAGCGFAHDDECEGERCRECNGTGYMICEVEADR